MRSILVFIALIAISIARIGSIEAAVINYGSLMGNSLFFNSISETSGSIPIPAPNLFGAPSVLGDMLIFSPLSFEANQTGAGLNAISSLLNVSLVAKPGLFITGVLVEEFGDYTIATPFAGGGGTVTAALNAIATTPAPIVDAQFLNVSSNTPPGILATNWTLSLPLNFGPAGSVGFQLTNTLTAQSSTLFDASFIKKKGIKLTVSTTTTPTVPEPTSAMAFLVFGLAGLPLYRRR